MNENIIILMLLWSALGMIIYCETCMSRKRAWWGARITAAEATGNIKTISKAYMDYFSECVLGGGNSSDMGRYKIRNGQPIRIGKKGMIERPWI